MCIYSFINLLFIVDVCIYNYIYIYTGMCIYDMYAHVRATWICANIRMFVTSKCDLWSLKAQ